jgi:hypothetical protein
MRQSSAWASRVDRISGELCYPIDVHKTAADALLARHASKCAAAAVIRKRSYALSDARPPEFWMLAGTGRTLRALETPMVRQAPLELSGRTGLTMARDRCRRGRDGSRTRT